MRSDIVAYNDALGDFKDNANQLFLELEKLAPNLEVKIWHRTVVFFDDGNPLFGYSLKKHGLELMFWSGQAFENQKGLDPVGSFKAARIILSPKANLPMSLIKTWVKEAFTVQFDYKNIVKNKGVLERIK
ncbi:hypothetical protein JV173_06940 [Acholeplasma equirhinis]|uniref:hypothetical protein n=1 Tax=Acholeplasma equirhinis TaxID=555393 RepID=UPI00197AEB1C|nr:hypothetical protein [Acholeplasma equirhinis]MBN3491232.1 hypothetical protein [Acholeplasma equirhinis]